jgi:hypothetical protein
VIDAGTIESFAKPYSPCGIAALRDPFGGFHRAGFFTPMKRVHFSEVTGGRN